MPPLRLSKNIAEKYVTINPLEGGGHEVIVANWRLVDYLSSRIQRTLVE